MNRKNNYLVLAIISFADVGSIRYWLTTPQKYKNRAALYNSENKAKRSECRAG
jgi:hypothetical protein